MGYFHIHCHSTFDFSFKLPSPKCCVQKCTVNVYFVIFFDEVCRKLINAKCSLNEWGKQAMWVREGEEGLGRGRGGIVEGGKFFT